MTSRSTAAIAAAALTVGLLTGAAGAIVVGNATADSTVDRHYEHMGSVMEAMGSGADMGAMMEPMGGSMMGGSMMGEPGGEMGPGSSQHNAHHPDANQ